MAFALKEKPVITSTPLERTPGTREKWNAQAGDEGKGMGAFGRAVKEFTVRRDGGAFYYERCNERGSIQRGFVIEMSVAKDGSLENIAIVPKQIVKESARNAASLDEAAGIIKELIGDEAAGRVKEMTGGLDLKGYLEKVHGDIKDFMRTKQFADAVIELGGKPELPNIL